MRDIDETHPGYDKAAALPNPSGWTERHLFRSEGVPIAEIPRGVKAGSFTPTRSIRHNERNATPSAPAETERPSRHPTEGSSILDTRAGAPCPHTASASTPSMAAVT